MVQQPSAIEFKYQVLMNSIDRFCSFPGSLGLGAIAALLLSTTGLVAQEARPEGRRPPHHAGKGALEAAFERHDIDKSGFIEEAEFSGPAERFAQADADKDGKLTRGELQTVARARLGENRREGRHNRGEMRRQGPPEGRPHDPPPGKASGSPNGRGRGGAPAAMFSRLDANGDEKVSLEEFLARPGKGDKARAEEAFAKADADADGSLSQQEFPNLMKSRPSAGAKAPGGKAGKS